MHGIPGITPLRTWSRIVPMFRRMFGLPWTHKHPGLADTQNIAGSSSPSSRSFDFFFSNTSLSLAKDEAVDMAEVVEPPGLSVVKFH